MFQPRLLGRAGSGGGSVSLAMGMEGSAWLTAGGGVLPSAQ